MTRRSTGGVKWLRAFRITGKCRKFNGFLIVSIQGCTSRTVSLPLPCSKCYQEYSDMLVNVETTLEVWVNPQQTAKLVYRTVLLLGCCRWTTCVSKGG